MADPPLSYYVGLAADSIENGLRCSESKIYELSQTISECLVFNWSDSSTVAIYQKLFITQAALCEIYFRLETQGIERLRLTPISAWIEACQSSGGDLGEFGDNTEIEASDEYLHPNVVFFGDESNFYGVTEDKVSEMLESFWRKFNDHTEIEPSLRVLGLSSGAGMSEIRTKYRALASEHHPDRGGNPRRFVEVRQAYEVLKRRFV